MIRVAIIEDSSMYQAYLKKVIDSDPFIKLSWCASSSKEAIKLLEKDKPDIISLDLNLPDVSDFSLLKKLVNNYKIPTIVVTSNGLACVDAIKLGAVDFMEKIDGESVKTMEQFSLLWRMKLKMQAKTNSNIKINKQPLMTNNKEDIIVIGASLGGTEAILEVIKDLPVDMPGIVIVQHMPAGFTNAYATRLDRNCTLKVVEATNHMKVERGKVIIAKGGEQITVRQGINGYFVYSKPDEKVSGFCPSVDVLFSSTAKVAGDNALAVILTGIGKDGSIGMKKLHDAGAYTIGQNEETCVVYGMPRAAKENGAIDRELPLDKISKALIKHFEK